MKNKNSTQTQRKTWHLDATDQTLGRFATRVAVLLRGKHKRSFEPHKDEGDVVYVENASKIHVSGNKMTEKKYFSYSGYPGGMRAEKFVDLLNRRPEKIIQLAVWRMLPKNKLRNRMIRRLHVTR